MPYSQDLRLRVLGAIDAGMSKMTAHQTFQISRSTIDDWLRLRAQTGSVQAPAAEWRRGGRGLAAQAGFAAFAQRHQHSTLEQMRQAWQQERQQSLSAMSFSRALRHRGYTRKKRAISTENGIPKSAKPLRSRSRQ